MDKTVLYRKLDIDTIDEFRYYENLASLLEEDDFIEENLIRDLIREVDKEVLADDETELYLTVDSIGRAMTGLISADMTDEDVSALAEEISRFRKWYVHDLNVFDKMTGTELSVRDARYNIVAARFLGEKTDYDFRNALDYSVEGYDVRIGE